MSNARSPREVCSTTMGTRGLIARASLATRLALLGRPQLTFGTAFLLRGPQLLPGVGLLLGDRLRRVGYHVRRLAQAHLLAQQGVAALRSQAVEQLLRSGPLMLLGGVAQPLHQLLVEDLDLLLVGDRRQHRLAL